ncbi:MAG: M20 family metallo-hydrolase [bacterium]|nr:M20 family metallo-hydrolase [bacterium]
MKYVFVVALVGMALTSLWAQESVELRVDGDRLNRRLAELAQYGKNAQGGMDRFAFSEADLESRPYLRKAMEEAGLEVHSDEAGNMIGRRSGRNSDLAPILIGSHSDSVPDGGVFDGALGVLSAIECAQVLYENRVTTLHPIEVVIFTDEEGGLVGSKAMLGELSEEALREVSHSGKTISEGISFLGGNPGLLENVVRKEGDVAAFLEIHIEQGKILETEKVEIGVVEGIVGIKWWDVTIEGSANHAGTTPMNMRRDALLSAAHLVIAVNRVVTSMPGSQVGTVGEIRAEPGAPNVIPGRVEMSLELRDLSESKVADLFDLIASEAVAIEKKLGTKITFDRSDTSSTPALTDPRLREAIAKSAEKLGLSYKLMPSGAGHDAQAMAEIAPTGMIFIPSVDGISHSPKEYSSPGDIVNGANVLLHTILEIDRGL